MKSTLCRQIRYIDLRTLLGQIRQNLKNSLCRQLGYFDKITLRGQIWKNDKQLYVANYALLI